MTIDYPKMYGWVYEHRLTLYVFFSLYVGTLRAPTAQSSQLYLSFFSMANSIAANLARAFNTSVESSPNFEPAVAKRVQQTVPPVPVATQTIVTQTSIPEVPNGGITK